MSSLKQTLADLNARHTREILDALAGASMQDLQDVVAGVRGERRRSMRPRSSSRSGRSTTATGHALELLAVDLVAHLKKHGPTRSEDLRAALGMSRQNMGKALALATEWKMVSKAGEKRATTYKALKPRWPKAELTVGDRMRVAALMK